MIFESIGIIYPSWTLRTYNEFITCFHEFLNYESTISFNKVTFGFLWHKFCFKKIHWSDNSLLQIKSSNEKNLWFIPHFDYCEKCFTLKPFFLTFGRCFLGCWGRSIMDFEILSDEKQFFAKLPKNCLTNCMQFLSLLGLYQAEGRRQ